MVDDTATNDYLNWNEIISEHFFNEEKADKEVLLYVNESLITKLGARYGAGLNDFILTVKDGPNWVTRSGFCQKAIQTYQNWRNKGFKYPPYIAYLACFVLAAATEGDFAVQAYYPRLHKLLGEPEDTGTPPSFERMIDLWDDLEKWSREDTHEKLGRFEARIRGSWWKVGLPLSQTLISDEERKHLPNLFNEADLDPMDVPSTDVILRVLRDFGNSVLEKRTYNLLNSNKPDDIVLKDALLNLVLDELEEWDGTLVEEEETEATPVRQTHAGLRICLAIDSVANTVTCYVRFKTGKSFPEEGLNFSSDGDSHIWSCTEIHHGWSKIFRDYEKRPPIKLDGALLDWVGGAYFRDPENQWSARLRGTTTKLFIPGRFESLSDWIEKQRLERNIEFLIASYGDDINKIREWGRNSCTDFKDIRVKGLPDGWMLFSGRNATQSCPDIEVLTISSTIRLLVRGGIKTGTGNAYLKFAPPTIVIENGIGNETVLLNSNELQKDEGLPVWYLPLDAPVGEPLRIEVSVESHVLKRILRLEEPELPLLADYNSRRNARGDFVAKEPSQFQACGALVFCPPGYHFPPVPHEPPLHLSERITFLGARPGEIVDWPHEGLPSDWKPVWAVSKTARKQLEAVFCEDPEQGLERYLPGAPLADKLLVKRWKEVIWHQRKIVKRPYLGKIRDIWERYLAVAKNV